jgi:hypothetical protein
MKKLLASLAMALVILIFSNVAPSYGYDNSIFLSNYSGGAADMKLSFMCAAGEKSYGDNVVYNLTSLQDIRIINPIQECIGSGMNSEFSTKFSASLTIQGSNNMVNINMVTTRSQMATSESCEITIEGATMSPSITRESGPNDCGIVLLYQ